MPTDEETNATIKDLKKQRSIIQSSFTRIGKSIERLLSSDDSELSVIEKSLEELSEKY
jgi:hypothetical protein